MWRHSGGRGILTTKSEPLHLVKSRDCGSSQHADRGLGEATLGKKRTEGTSKTRVKLAKKNMMCGPVEPVNQVQQNTLKTMDAGEVRQNIKNLVGNSAAEITSGVIEKAREGQLAAAKYLFEVAGLHPLMEETAGKPEEYSLAQSLWKRIGLPIEGGSGGTEQSAVDTTGAGEKLDEAEDK